MDDEEECFSPSNADPNQNSLSTAAESALEVERDFDLRQPYWCEENVWRLAYRKAHREDPQGLYVVFISNRVKSVPMFYQKASDDPLKCCCWDYHVLLIDATSGSGVQVYDIDSSLPYPCHLNQYVSLSFPYDWPDAYAPQFRVVAAALYLEHFASDRSHMYTSHLQRWNAPPPPYDCILPGSSNLKTYLDFCRPSPDERFGSILSLSQFENYFKSVTVRR